MVTADGSVAAHVEHTIALFDDGVWVLTAEDGGAARLGDLLASAATLLLAEQPRSAGRPAADALRGT